MKNKNKAMTVLRSRLLKKSKVKKRKNMQRRGRIRLGPGTVAKELGHTIFQSRITDHRINYSAHSLGETLMGDMDHLIDILATEDRHSKLRELTSGEI